jgi:predicted DNA binding protein
LPKDLPGALARLDDGKIDVLLTAVIGEARRRDRLSSNLMAKSLDSDQRPLKVSQSKTAVKYARAHPRQAHADDDAASLTQGQVNAVRAAFKAGIKPSMIARQFGISQSNVRKVLASQAQERKS